MAKLGTSAKKKTIIIVKIFFVCGACAPAV